MPRLNLRNLVGRWISGSDPDDLEADYEDPDKPPLRGHGPADRDDAPEKRAKPEHRPKRPSKRSDTELD